MINVGKMAECVGEKGKGMSGAYALPPPASNVPSGGLGTEEESGNICGMTGCLDRKGQGWPGLGVGARGASGPSAGLVRAE